MCFIIQASRKIIPQVTFRNVKLTLNENFKIIVLALFSIGIKLD